MNLYFKHLFLIAVLMSTSFCSGLNGYGGENMARQIEFNVDDEYRVSIPVSGGVIGIHVQQNSPIFLKTNDYIGVFDAFFDRKKKWGSRDLHNTHLSSVLFRLDGYSESDPIKTSDLRQKLYKFSTEEYDSDRYANFEQVMHGDREWLKLDLVGESIREKNKLVLRPPGAAYATAIGNGYVLKISLTVDEKFAKNSEKFEAGKDMLEAVVKAVRITKAE